MANKKLTIKAECHSDDHAVEVTFDAVPFFKKATYKEILALAKCGWGGDYPADEVAIYMAGKNKEVKDMFTYVEARRKQADVGFECHVDKVEAINWLLKNRPKIHAKLMDEKSETTSPKISAEDILREFSSDVRIAYGETGKIDTEAMDWPDLYETFLKAEKFLYPKRK
jgi:hypothetical protein